MTLAEFPAHFRRRFPQLPGRRVVVALSGGADSVALLHLLADPGLALELEAAHVHHGVRGAEADGDAAFCAELCLSLGVPFHLLRLEAQPSPAEGREAAWRTARYRTLGELTDRLGAAAVATAHHRDDVAEGVLLQLLRGAGVRALAGIAEARAGVIRPLLPWRRAELEAWLDERGIGWREDSSNHDPTHLRNRVRHAVLPELERISPRLREHLVRLAGALAADEAVLADLVAARTRLADPWDPNGGVPLTEVAALPTALRNRWLHATAAGAGVGRVSHRQLELFEGLLDAAEPRAVTLAGRWRLRLAGGSLWLEPPSPPSLRPFSLPPGEIRELSLPGWEVRLVAAAAADPGARFSLRRGDGPASLRSLRPGDVVGAVGRRRPLAPLLAKHLPLHLRRAWPLLVEDDTITWVPGVWRDPGAGSEGAQVLEVRRR